ncbi:MAG: hypothetical protein HRF43_17590, partial [Phycisphaerae bacterium]
MALRRIVIVAFLGGSFIPSSAPAGAPLPPVGLAKSVPPEVRLYLELTDVQAFLETGAGKELAELLEGLVPPTATRAASRPSASQAALTPPATQAAATRPAAAPAGSQPTTGPPASGPATSAASAAASPPVASRPTPPPRLAPWQQALGHKLGLRSERAAQLLFTGRLAIAADGWRSLDDAVLLTQPIDPAALEQELQALRIPSPADARVRRYGLDDHHELACDGQTAVIGRRTDPHGVYQRTVTLWAIGRRVSLADQPDFRDRIAALPGEAQIVFYTGTTLLPPLPSAASMPAEPLGLMIPEVRTAAVGAIINGNGVTVEVSARLTGDPRPQNPADPPIDSLLRLPGSTLAAWTRPIRYLEEFRRLVANYPDGSLRFYLEVIQTGLPAGALEKDLLAHLVGDTIVLISRQPLSAPAGAPGPALLLPVAALTVETDDPEAVGRVLAQMADNVLKLVNLSPPPSGPLALRTVEMGPGWPAIHVLPLGRFFETYTACELLRSLEISWTLADRWLVVATHPETVRQIAQARRGQGEPLPVGGLPAALTRVRSKHGTPQMVLVARPRAGADMIQSWLDYIAVHHPDMLAADWWQQLRRRQLAGSVQLGIVPRPTTQPGVWVDRTLEGWPAHRRLLPGDQVLSVDNQNVDPARPLPSLRELMASRAHSGRVELRIVRSGREMSVTVPMGNGSADEPPIRPLELLADFADVLRAFSSASFVTWEPAPGMVNARLELE